MDKRPRGRPPLGEQAMSKAEINRRWRERVAKAEAARKVALDSILLVKTLEEAKKIAEGALKDA